MADKRRRVKGKDLDKGGQAFSSDAPTPSKRRLPKEQTGDSRDKAPASSGQNPEKIAKAAKARRTEQDVNTTVNKAAAYGEQARPKSARRIKRKGPGGKIESFLEHYPTKIEGSFASALEYARVDQTNLNRNLSAFDDLKPGPDQPRDAVFNELAGPTAQSEAARDDGQKAPRRGPSTKASDPSPTGLRIRHVPGPVYDATNPADPHSVLRAVVRRAGELETTYDRKQASPKARRERAITEAIQEWQNTAPGSNMSLVTPQRIGSMAFEPTVKHVTAKEATLATGQTSENRKILAKRLKDSDAKQAAQFRATGRGRAPGANFPGLGYGGTTDTGRPRISTGPRGEATLSSSRRGVGVPQREADGKTLISEKVQKATKAKAEQKKNLQPGQAVPKGKLTNKQFLASLDPDEANWVQEQLTDPKGLFFGATGNKVPGAYRRFQRYSSARQDTNASRTKGWQAPIDAKGKTDTSHSTYKWLTADNRGKSRQTNPNRRDKAESDTAIKSRATAGIIHKEGVKASDRYKSGIPSHEDFGVGIRLPGPRSKSQLKDAHPDAGDRELFELHQSDLQSISDIQQNQKMAYEGRQATILGRSPSETGAGKDDRVVFFTTSTGWPAVSVGANSLLGQYIVKKRKKMLYDQRMAPRALLKGEFPYAVRDQHVVEVATGLSLGAQGRYGAFRHVGYRAGSKKSKGYGKMLPVGSQILRDSSGQPLYDSNGNLRYSEGFTRPFDIRPSGEVGLRIYLG